MNPNVETIDPEPGQQAAYREISPVAESTYQGFVSIYDQLDVLP